MKSSVLGLFGGLIIVIFAVRNTGKDSAMYLNYISFLIVFGGTFSVAVITYGVKRLLKIFMLFFKAFSTSNYANVDIVHELVDISKKVYYNEDSLENITNQKIHPFIADGLRMIHNKFDRPKIKSVLINMLQERQKEHHKKIEQLDILSKYPPAFGMMGTIIGLIAVLRNLGEGSDISGIGPSMAVALITTLYGIFLSNYIIQPIGDNLLARSQDDMKIRRIISEGILLISANEDPIFVREMLLGYLMPKERDDFYGGSTASVGSEAAA